MRLESFEEALGVAEQEIALVLEVCVERRSADPRAVEHLLHRDLVELALEHQLDERTAEREARAHDAAIARRMRRSPGILGCVVGSATLVLLLSGHLTLDVHGLGAAALAQTVWLVLVGLEPRRAPAAQSQPSP